MNMLIEELQSLASDWRSWMVVGVMAILAAISVFQTFKCPWLSGNTNPSDDEVAEAKILHKNVSVRFALAMLVGFVLTLTGLLMIAYGVKPTLALAAMVIGLVVIQTEPARLKIREARRMVLACADGPEDSRVSARGRLRGSYRELAAVNVGLLVCLVGGMLAF